MCYFPLPSSELKHGWQFRQPVGSFHHVTSPKAFLRLPAQRPVESAKEPDAADKISFTVGIWGLCLPAERRGQMAQCWGRGWQRDSSRTSTHFLFKVGKQQVQRAFHNSGKTGINESELHLGFISKNRLRIGQLYVVTMDTCFIESLLLFFISRMQQSFCN